MKELFLDVETTGLSTEKHTIWQIAGMFRNTGTQADNQPFEMKIQPSILRCWDEKVATNPDLITTDTLMRLLKLGEGIASTRGGFSNFGRKLDKVVNKFQKTDKLRFIAYNAKFDWDHIFAWFELLGNKYCGSYFFFPPIDVACLAAMHFGDERANMPSFKQSDVAKALGIEVDEKRLHDAAYDISLLVQIYDKVNHKL